jgi:hypothetical protein
VYTKGNPGLGFGVWLVDPDGSNLRTVANPGLGPAWSLDGRWLYYATRGGAGAEIVMKKVPASGGTPVTVTTEKLRNVIGYDGSTVYYTFERPLVDGRPEFEIRSAQPEDAPFKVLARIPASRVPLWQIVNPALSPDGNGWRRRSPTARRRTSGRSRRRTANGARSPTSATGRRSWRAASPGRRTDGSFSRPSAKAMRILCYSRDSSPARCIE